MNFGRLGRGEAIAAIGGLLLALCVFLPWYQTDPDNRNATLDGLRGTFSAWQAHSILRWLLLGAAAAPFILVWIIIREHELSWPHGEMTAVVAIAAFGLAGYAGVIDRPGESGQIGLQPGWFGAMVGIVLMMTGGAMRAATIERRRKPPGVL